MCVICVAPEDKRPTEEQIRQMWIRNPEGGGVAWRDIVDGVQVVRWKKGLKLEEMKKLGAELPLPYILHFRIASIGGPLPELTHPFVAVPKWEDFVNSLNLEGATTDPLVFHNGHWSEWHDKMIQGCGATKEQFPRGPWSDSRAMAFLYRHFGQGFLDTLEQRTVTFGPDLLEFGIGKGWYEKDGLWFSNNAWETFTQVTKFDGHRRTTGFVMCQWKNCAQTADLDADGRCRKHPRGTDGKREGHHQAGHQSSITKSGLKEEAARDPFALLTKLVQGELAWGLQQSGIIEKVDAQAVCSKSGLRNMRKAAAALRASSILSVH